MYRICIFQKKIFKLFTQYETILNSLIFFSLSVAQAITAENFAMHLRVVIIVSMMVNVQSVTKIVLQGDTNVQLAGKSAL